MNGRLWALLWLEWGRNNRQNERIVYVGVSWGGDVGASAPPIFLPPNKNLVSQECVHLE